MTVPDAIVAAVTAAVSPVKNYDGIVPEKPPERYVVTYPDTGTLSALAICAISDAAVFRFTTHAVAPDRGMAAWLSTTVRDGIVDTRLVVAGWSLGQIVHTFSQPPVRNETVMERPVLNAIDTYTVVAQRLAA